MIVVPLVPAVPAPAFVPPSQSTPPIPAIDIEAVPLIVKSPVQLRTAIPPFVTAPEKVRIAVPVIDIDE